jgi:hypothetical protein
MPSPLSLHYQAVVRRGPAPKSISGGRSGTLRRPRDQQLHNAAAARRDFDRVAEVQARREAARGIERERQQERGPRPT